MITGCSHAGAVNTLLHARTLIGEGQPQTLVGGLHLIGADKDRQEATVRGMHELDLAEIRPGHCTGARAEAALTGRFAERHRPFSTGDRFTYRRSR